MLRISLICLAFCAGAVAAAEPPRPEARPDIWNKRAPVASPDVRPVQRVHGMPRTRWDFRRDSALWTRAAMSAIDAHGAPLLDVVPRDIAEWCPAYPEASDEQRKAFWVGLMSSLSKHESTYNPQAVGGGNLWFGLLQIYPPTARGYGCHATTGRMLTDAADNLSCAVRIMAVTVPRDNAVALHDGRWRGVAADWGPMVSSAKRRDMARWTRRQTYCRLMADVRPQGRPGRVVEQARASQSYPLPR
ncbi:transglycosylase SLT domain-containing protein [Aestuariibius sp. 2305UL40-4]|uniref:transglycosylase SLT domain-containing protein n=1 Tax=Aestuariibius violaceus TaxID=3234132 RepID=UPI00345E869B